MRLYATPAGRWAGTQADAKELAKQDGRWFEQDVPTDKAGLLGWLNVRQVGAGRAEAPSTIDTAPAFAAPAYGEMSVATDEAFDALPLARRLELAARALEDARIQIKPANAA